MRTVEIPHSELELTLEENDSPVRELVLPFLLTLPAGVLIRAYVSTAREVLTHDTDYGLPEGAKRQYVPCARGELKKREPALKIEIINPETGKVDAA